MICFTVPMDDTNISVATFVYVLLLKITSAATVNVRENFTAISRVAFSFNN